MTSETGIDNIKSGLKRLSGNSDFEYLILYINDNIHDMQIRMETVNSVEDMRFIQGKIKSLRMLLQFINN